MKTVLTTQRISSNFYAVKRTLLLWMVLISCVSVAFSQGSGIGGTVGGYGGNPYPEFCDEPCDTVLKRWFEITITPTGSNAVLVNGFDFQNLFFSQFGSSNPASAFQVVSWSLLHASSQYDPVSHSHIAVYANGIHIGGIFEPFSLGQAWVGAGQPAKFYLEVQAIGCISEEENQHLPNGTYSLSYDVYTNQGRYRFTSQPVTSCDSDVTILPTEYELEPYEDYHGTMSLMGFGGGGRLGDQHTQQNIQDLIVAPNPVTDRSIFTFNLTEESACTLNLYNMQGQKVMSHMEDEVLSEGMHKQTINLSSLPTGVYFAKLETSQGIKTVRVLKQ